MRLTIERIVAIRPKQGTVFNELDGLLDLRNSLLCETIALLQVNEEMKAQMEDIPLNLMNLQKSDYANIMVFGI